MKCDIVDCTNFTIAADNHCIMKCLGCNFTFHPVCAGVQRRSENEILRYMVPMCKKCSLDLLSQRELSMAVIKQNRSVKMIEATLKGYEETLDNLSKLSIKETVDEVKNQINQLSKSVSAAHRKMLESNSVLKDDLQAEMTELHKQNFKNLKAELKPLLVSVTEELTALNAKSQPAYSQISQDLLDEIRNWQEKTTNHQKHTNVMTTMDNAPAPASLADELASTSLPVSSKSTSTTASGWRNFGNKLVWKPQCGWEDYDRRMKVRAEQHKAADRARHRRHQNKRRHNSKSVKNSNSKKSNYNHKTHKPTVGPGEKNNLPSDKSMLAAAKTLFAGNAKTSHPPDSRFIPFKQGETLYPYKKWSTQSSSTSPLVTVAGNTPVSSFNYYNRTVHSPAVIPTTSAAACRFNTILQTPLCSSHVTPHQPDICNCNACRQLNGPNFMMY